MSTIMDQSLCPGNYFDYPDDETARQRELELIENFTGVFIDDIFPPNARSLYLDPLNPPKGALPNESIKWFSISEGGLLGCEAPVLFKEDPGSANIIQGALGNNYFISAVSLLACSPKYINRLIVSNKYASRGLYTFKFYKSGRWRYVHVDDHIACRQSGKVHFCRNANPNETFAMLMEKAYAKLHGCYEALSFGLVEHALLDLTPAAGVQTLRLDQIHRTRLCDDAWDAMEAHITKGAMIGCMRVTNDSGAENPAIRQGIDIGVLYQVVDICITSAEPTEDYDALTVGMVCVRNLKTSSGRFNGRWSFGHKLWLDYKEIALDLRHRTREIQHKRGIGEHPDEMPTEARLDSRYLTASQPLEMGGDEIDNEDEADTIDGGYQERRLPFKMVQPMADDLHWIQIEDFVDIFTRIVVVNDLSFEKKFTTKRFVSKWLPGDYLVGSGGPPIVIEKHELPPDEDEDEFVSLPPQSQEPNSHLAETSLQSQSLISASTPASEASPKQSRPPPKKIPKPVKYQKVAFLSDTFTDNPMFPFTVSEPARMVITLQQLDQRWNVGRLGDDPTSMPIHRFMPRGQRLESVMQYSVGIAFLVVRLSGMKVRLTDFKLRKIAYTSKRLVFAHANSVHFDLFPGRYAVIPYTHCVLDRAMDYALHFQYFSHQIEFEIEDPILQRLQDRAASDDGIDDENEPDDNDLLQVNNEDNDDVSVLSYDRGLLEDDDDEHNGTKNNSSMNHKSIEDSRVMRPSDMRGGGGGGGDDGSLASGLSQGGGGGGGPRVQHVRLVPLPRMMLIPPWEYREDVDDLAMMHMYGEVGNMMKYLRSLRGEIRKLNGTIRALTMTDRGQNIMSQTQQNNLPPI